MYVSKKRLIIWSGYGVLLIWCQATDQTIIVFLKNKATQNNIRASFSDMD